MKANGCTVCDKYQIISVEGKEKKESGEQTKSWDSEQHKYADKLDQMALFCFCHNLCSWNLQSLKLVLETKIPLSQLIAIHACGFICSISYPL